MVRIDRPAVGPDLARKTLELLPLYRLIVAVLARALEGAPKEKAAIASVRDLMVRHRRDPALAQALARLAPGNSIELGFAAQLPGLCRVPFSPGLSGSAPFVSCTP
jgi:hypothetical protein